MDSAYTVRSRGRFLYLPLAAACIVLSACGDRSTALKELGGKQILCRTYDTPTKEVFARFLEAEFASFMFGPVPKDYFAESRRLKFTEALRQIEASKTFKTTECDQLSHDLCLMSVQCREVNLASIKPVGTTYFLIIDTKAGALIPIEASRKYDANPVDSDTGRRSSGLVFRIQTSADLRKRLDETFERFWPLGE
ncbi:hypothetical protein SAMN05428967_3359 [Phyllobacterium sp. YR620]|uniref:hypothetical protein n=1 Tax=Phyllobacterium sp. YR620 TaxID=1881066 RepID=UPI00088EA944|nr:hypothetical protein [Phyllobacterium sp. YR620]SDP77243.1 hypothetical protein SAMN05428967_3359 [Phyllobacterium sp. YR620]